MRSIKLKQLSIAANTQAPVYVRVDIRGNVHYPRGLSDYSIVTI